MTTGVGKASALAAQIVLGWILFEDDWGLYALTLSVAALLQLLRNGGIGHVLIQRGPDAYAALSGPAFWMAATFNAVACVLFLIVGSIAAAAYEQPALAPMLWVTGLALVLGTPAAVLRAKLFTVLAFRTAGAISAATSIARWACAVALAAAGMGAMSFIWSMLAAAIVEGFLSWLAARDSPWKRKPNFAAWPGIFRSGAWVLFGSFAAALAQRADYLVLGFLVSVALVGQYTFGYELAGQVGAVLASNLQSILFPVMTRVVTDSRRLADAAERTVGVLILACTAPSLLLAAGAEPLELALWDGKWASAVPVVQAFAIVMPIHVMSTVPHSILLAKGRFATRSMILLAQAGVLAAGAFAGVTLFDASVGAIAASVGICQALFAVLATLVILSATGCSVRRLTLAFIKPWLVGAAAGVVAFGVDRILPWPSQPWVRLFVISATFALLFVPLARLYLVDDLERLAGVLPDSARRVFRVVWWLPAVRSPVEL